MIVSEACCELAHSLLQFEQKNRPLLLVAEDLESDALQLLILNKHHVGLKVISYLALL